MKLNRFGILAIVFILLIAVILIVITLLVPENTNPAFAAAIEFVNAAGTGDEDDAVKNLSPELQTYIAENCPDGLVSACIESYAPDEWGDFRSVVFRRATPDGDKAWDVDLIGTYETGVGASGVCVYNRVEQAADGNWYVTKWAGFIHCAEAASRDMESNPDTPNRAP